MLQACRDAFRRLILLAFGVLFLYCVIACASEALQRLLAGRVLAFIGGALLSLMIALFMAMCFFGAFSKSVEALEQESQERAAEQKHKKALRRIQEKSRRAIRRSPYAVAITAAANAGPRVLSQEETDNAQRLIREGTADAVTLAVSVLKSCTAADIAAVFTPAVINRVVYRTHPTCLPLVAHTLSHVEPCFHLLLLDVGERLFDPDEADFIYPGSPACHLNPARQDLYRVLLEAEFPSGFVVGLRGLPLCLERHVFNYNMSGSWYQWSFTGESLEALSSAGASLLARLAVVEPAKENPIWGDLHCDLGRFIILSRLTTLTDEIAAALSEAQRALVFGSLRSFPDTPGHVRLAHRLARQERVFLGRHTVIAPAIAQILVSKL